MWPARAPSSHEVAALVEQEVCRQVLVLVARQKRLDDYRSLEAERHEPLDGLLVLVVELGLHRAHHAAAAAAAHPSEPSHHRRHHLGRQAELLLHLGRLQHLLHLGRLQQLLQRLGVLKEALQHLGPLLQHRLQPGRRRRAAARALPSPRRNHRRRSGRRRRRRAPRRDGLHPAQAQADDGLRGPREGRGLGISVGPGLARDAHEFAHTISMSTHIHTPLQCFHSFEGSRGAGLNEREWRYYYCFTCMQTRRGYESTLYVTFALSSMPRSSHAATSCSR
mmetsp:Transcript_40895/g.123817  ORF Transcript_40895/g.123817 Transcript_40895/m.123817 type:complete len:279 (-) Transcript_40895:100-936(-)